MDPDQPTRQQRPSDPPPPGGVRESEVVYEDDGRRWQAHVLERLDSLRTAVVLLGVIAVVALGVAVYALLEASGEDEGDGRGASSSRVSGIEDRLDKLESRQDDQAGQDAVSDLRSDQKALADRLDSLEEGSQSGGDVQEDVDALRESVDELSQAVTTLDERVEEIENRQDQQEQQQQQP